MSFLFKSSDSQPAQAQAVTTRTAEYAPEQKPYVTEIFSEAQKQYEAEKGRGYTPFPGPQLAGFTPEEQQSFEMYRQIAGGPGAQPFYTGATLASLGAAQDILGPEIFARMSPYQQAVTDVAQREAIRQFRTGPLQQIRTGATAEGGLRGSRRAIAEEEGLRNLEQRLADIQTLGSQQAYTQALAEAASQRGRLAGLAGVLPTLGTGLTAAQQQQAALLGGVGEAQRGMQQQAIDLAMKQFYEEQDYPARALSRYLGFISGAPQPTGFTGTTPVAPGPSRLSQFASLAGGLGTLAGGLFGDKGIPFGNTGGRVGGLSSIVRRQAGGKVVRMQEGEAVPAPDESWSVSKIPALQDIQNIRFPQSVVVDYLRRNVGPAISGTLSDIYDVAGEGVEYLTGIQTPSATEALTNLGLSPEQAAALSGEGRGVLSAPLGLVGGDIKGLVGEAPKRVTAPKKVEQPVAEPAPEPVEQAVQTTAKNLAQKDVVQQPVTPDTQSDLEKMYVEALKKAVKDTEDTGMTWSERLQLAAAFFAAGDSPDMFSFFKNAAAGAAPVFAGMEKADKAKAQTALSLAKNAYDLQRDRRQDLREDRKVQATLMTATAALIKAAQDNPYKALPKTAIETFQTAYEASQGVRLSNEAIAVIADEAARSPNSDPMDVIDSLMKKGVLGKESSFFGLGTPTLEVQRQAQKTPDVQYQIKK